MPRPLLLAVMLVAWMQVSIDAHPGHGVAGLLTGTIVSADSKRVQLEVFDRASASIQKVWVVVDDTTGVRAGKDRLKLADLRVGQQVECATETDEGPDGATILRAITFRLKPAKQDF